MSLLAAVWSRVSLQYAIWLHKCRYNTLFSCTSVCRSVPFGRTCPYSTLFGCTSVCRYVPFGRTRPYNTLFVCTSVVTICHLVAQVSLLSAVWSHKCPYNTLLGCTSVLYSLPFGRPSAVDTLDPAVFKIARICSCVQD